MTRDFRTAFEFRKIKSRGHGGGLKWRRCFSSTLKIEPQERLRLFCTAFLSLEEQIAKLGTSRIYEFMTGCQDEGHG
jgi:hypothetical protein